MTASVIQERHASTTATVANMSLAFSSAVSAGNTIHAIGTVNGSTETFSFADGTNTYTDLGNAYAYTYNHNVGHAYAPNVAAGTPTVVVTFGASNTWGAIWIREIGGVVAAPLDGHAEGASGATAPTSFSVSPTNANSPAFISSLGTQWLTAGVGVSAVSPLVQDQVGWAGGGAQGYGTSAHENLTTTGAQTVEYQAASAVDFVIVAAIFDESPAGTASIAEGADSVTGAGSASVTGFAAIAEQGDIVVGTGSAGSAATAAITEGADIVSASGGLSTDGTAAITELSDAVVATGVGGGAGIATITELADTAQGIGLAGNSGIAAIAEAQDIVHGQGSVLIDAGATVLNVAQAQDALSMAQAQDTLRVFQ